ncbi:MAG: hypothetical protein DDT39_00899 [Firmicutes bacterium]|nr:hypothetical protein [candidate division NPL-UPA2 bacterium]
MSLNNRLLAALGLLVLLLSMVGCVRKSGEEDSRPPAVVAPPGITPVDKVVDVVIGERRSIARAQVAALKLRGAPLSLHRNILDISWTEATIDYPRIYLYNWNEGQSLLLDIHTGETLASGTRFTQALRDRWAEVTANKFGAFTDHRFGLTLWGEHQYAVASVTMYSHGLPQGDPSTQFGARWQGFVLTTAPDAQAVTIVGTYTDTGEMSFFRAYQGRYTSLAWSRRGNYMAVTATGDDAATAATAIYVYRRGILEPLFAVSRRDVQQALPELNDPVIVPHSAFWTSDERILHFTAAPALQQNNSRIFSIWRDGTGLAAMPPKPFDDRILREADAAMKAYRSAVEQRSLSRAAELPLSTVFDITGSRHSLRQHALELLQERRLLDLGGVFLVLDPTEPVVLPKTLRVWHDTNHYQGQILVILDAQGRRLAEYRLWEHGHYNMILQPTLLDLSATLPTSGRGYIVALRWNAKDGVMPLEDGVRIPVRFR